MHVNSKPVINHKAKYHVFIGTDFSRASQPQFDVCKYSLESLSSVDLSIIPIRSVNKLLVPTICKDLYLTGKALYVEDSCLFKGDVKDLFDLTDERALLWCVKEPRNDRSQWQRCMVFSLDLPALYTTLTPKAAQWAPYYADNFHFISKSAQVLETEVQPLPRAWHVKPSINDKIDYASIKLIDFIEEKPWVNHGTKYAKDWFKEYKLYLSNVVIKELQDLSK